MNGQPKEVLKPFKKGDQRINRKGRPPVLPDLKNVIAKILSEEKNEMTGLEAVIRALLIKAVKGDTRAAQELLDRYYGKATQPIDHTTEGEKIKQYRIEVTNHRTAEKLEKWLNNEND